MSSKLFGLLRIASGEDACDVLPTAHALQSTGLVNRCETVLYDFVTIEFADGKKSDTCRRVFYFLHLAEKCNLTTVLQFCTQVASEYLSDERREALEKFPVSTEVQLQIACMAEERHELLAEDERMLFQHRRWVMKMENSRNRLRQEDIKSLIGKRIGERGQSLRALRLAYFYFPDDIEILSSAVLQVRYQIQQDTITWKECFAREFMLLPLKVQSYIKGRKVNEF